MALAVGTVLLSAKDITTIAADVIVNSANPWLSGIGPVLEKEVGGVDGAIHRAAGIELYELCMKIPRFTGVANARGGTIGRLEEIRCGHGDVRITEACALPCKKILHAVAPRFVDGDSGELDLLKSLYDRIFFTLLALQLHSIVIPPLGTRSFGMPREESSGIAVRRACQFALRHKVNICFSVIDPEEYGMYDRTLRTILPG